MRRFNAFGAFATLITLLLSAGQLSQALAAGLPGEFLITQRWRELNSKYSPLSNPAFLTEENYLTLRGAYTPLLQKYFKFWEIGATVPIGLYHSAGISWIGEASKSYHPWKDGVEDLNSTISSQQHQFMLSYAINPWRGLSLGINANIVSQRSFDEQHTGIGADLALSYRVLKNPFFGNHILGINAQNILAPKLGEEVNSRNLRLTWYSTYWEKLVEANLDYCLKDFLAKASDFTDPNNSLIEYAKKMEWELCGRVGVAIMQMFRLYGLFGITDVGFNHWGLGLNVNMPVVNGGRDLSGAYQMVRLAKEKIYSNTMYLRAEFGKHREEAYAKWLAEQLDVAPNALYLKAMTLYSQGNYWDALFLYYQILSEYPDFFNNDWVAYYIGSCQERMDMREIGLLSFQSLEVNYPWSNSIIHGRLAAMRIHYRNSDFFNVEKYYKQLQEPTVSDTIKASANYLMAEAYMERKEYRTAVELFDRIPPGRPEYLYAQHSKACALMAQDKPAEAVACLQNCVTEQETDPARKEIINRSYLLLGYIMYEDLLKEEKPLSKAVTMFRLVNPKSIYFEEAQLGLGWTALKAQQFNDCITAGEALQNAKNTLLHFEGSLIAAYGYMNLQKYNEARDLLTKASDKIEALRPVSEDSVSLEKQRYLDTRAAYDLLAKKVAECAQKQQVDAVLSENKDLHGQQLSVKEKIDVSLDYFDAYKKNLFFTRNYETIKSDISYMLAVVSKRSAANVTFQKTTKVLEKEKNLDKELEKLKNEMEKLKGKAKKQDQ